MAEKKVLKWIVYLETMKTLQEPCVLTSQKIKFPIIDFFSKCDQIFSFLLIWSHLLKKFLMENFMFCEVKEEFIEKLVA